MTLPLLSIHVWTGNLSGFNQSPSQLRISLGFYHFSTPVFNSSPSITARSVYDTHIESVEVLSQRKPFLDPAFDRLALSCGGTMIIDLSLEMVDL
jgi:hypothetical protein